MRPSRFDIDYRRWSRWCLLGAVAMLLWVMAPVARCSWHAFRDTPLGEVAEEYAPGDSDRERVAQGTGFFPRWGRAVKGCYAATPIGSHGWKATLLYVLAGAWLLFGAIHRIESRRKRTFAPP